MGDLETLGNRKILLWRAPGLVTIFQKGGSHWNFVDPQ